VFPTGFHAKPSSEVLAVLPVSIRRSLGHSIVRRDTYKAIYGTAFYSLARSLSVKEQPVDRGFRLSKDELQYTDQGKRLQISPMTTLSLVGVPPRDGEFRLVEMISKQCEPSFCIQSHETTITNGQQSQHIWTEPQHLTWNSASNVGSLDLDAYTNSSFTIDITLST
jgi:hypothetical protein